MFVSGRAGHWLPSGLLSINSAWLVRTNSFLAWVIGLTSSLTSCLRCPLSPSTPFVLNGSALLAARGNRPQRKVANQHCSFSGSRELLRLVVNYQLGCKLFAFGGGLCVSLRFKTKQSKTRQIVSLHPKLLISSHVLKPCWAQSPQSSFHKEKKSHDQPA